MRLTDSINILLLGSGGREHALAKKIAESPRVAKLYIAEGNGGTSNCGTNVAINIGDFAAIKTFVLAHKINLVVVGPEGPLVKGIYDFFQNDHDIRYIPVVGPSKEAARLEGSKAFAKEFMVRHNIPTAAYRSFKANQLEDAFAFLGELRAPYVLKADGLAAGKGVVIADSLEEAKASLKEMFSGKFGEAGTSVVIEEYLSGIELSVFVLTDGKNYKILPNAKDYKRIGEQDTGLNTGGMGAVSPVPFATKEFLDRVEERVIRPTVDGIAKDKLIYNGFIFIGLMNVDGNPYVIEYNVRMGDPETEVVIPRIESDIIDLFEGVVFGTLGEKELTVSEKTAVTVMCVSGGYPENYENGFEITGLENAPEGSVIFHAGTKVTDGKVYTNGGRVLSVTSFGDDIRSATAQSYDIIDKIAFQKMYFRRDIGNDLI